MVENATAQGLTVLPMLILLLLVFTAGVFCISFFVVDGLRRGLLSATGEWQRRREQRSLSLRVTERRDIHDGLFIVKLAAGEGKRLPRFQPGQYLTLYVQTEADGPVWRRRYSLAAWQRRPQYYELCIKREPHGSISQWLHARLRPGALIDVLPPRGRFILDSRRRRTLVLVAGGVGIAPLRAMLHCAMGQGHGRAGLAVRLFYAARYQEQLCYVDEFTALAERHPQFRFYPVLSRPGDDWQGMRGRLTANTVLGTVMDPAQCLVYFCGPSSMFDVLEQGLCDQGVDPSHIFFERFRLDGSVSAERDFKVELEEGTVFWFQSQRTLLDALEDHGVAVASDCRTGECGVCKIHLSEGQVHEIVKPGARLEPQEILPCCCIPKSDLKLMVNIP